MEKDDRNSPKTQPLQGSRELWGRKTQAGRSVCGPGTSRVGITRQLVKNAASRAPRETCLVRICI